jgi:carboxyl-terminal processing protease
MNKIIIIPLMLFAAACSGKPKEPEVLKIFALHSYQEYAPQRISELLRGEGAAGLAKLDPRAAILENKRPVRARPTVGLGSSGLLAGERDGGLVLLKVFERSPAAGAGLREGDRLLALDGEPLTPESAARLLAGKMSFTLKAERNGAPLEAGVVRGQFYFPQLFAFYDPPSRTLFLRVGLFFEGSAAPVLAAVEAAAARGARSVVFDLRDNPGGVPAEAAEVLKAFAPRAGTLIELRSRHARYSALYRAEGRGRFAGLKTAVLVNSGTAMAAEIFARSLKETAGGLTVGSATAGSVSRVRAFALSDGRGLELAVARLFPPSGLDLEGAGAQPDAAAGPPGSRLVWDNSRELTLLGDAPWLKALELLSPPAGRVR